MPRSIKTLALICGALLLALGLQEGVASACTFRCSVVSTSPFCLRCIDTGVFNGVTCQNQGSCGCIFTQNNCNGLRAAAVAPPDLAAEAILAATDPQSAPQPAPPLTAAPATDLEAAIFAD